MAQRLQILRFPPPPAFSSSSPSHKYPTPGTARPRHPCLARRSTLSTDPTRTPSNQHPILSLSGRGPLLPPLGSIDMGRAPCCEKEGLRRGAWSPEEDQRLAAYIQQHGHPNWRALPRQAGLLRCGKSCRLRWINYLRPDIKRGNFSADEEALIVRLHAELGNSRLETITYPPPPQAREDKSPEIPSRLASRAVPYENPGQCCGNIAIRFTTCAAQTAPAHGPHHTHCSAHLPGRTDNEIKNVWHTHIKKRLEAADPESNARAKQQKQRKGKPAAAKKATAAVDSSSEQQTFTTASPGLSSSVSSGVTTATESTAAVSSGDDASLHQLGTGATKAEMEMESFSSAEFPPIDESFWSSPDVMDMGLGAMGEELVGLAGPPSSSTRDEDMEFWLKMLLEAGDMRDLSVL
ncbi:hypothetical protein HU200_049481 [Digitaria exilis]|uniref:Uncharacterized protein n=1 Tax=Digitaria exilis TaxID=1010633 RepID=A0A835ASU4_9POAL|nr:hypothetical protein HU200_049481 [Digitaria exilis]